MECLLFPITCQVTDPSGSLLPETPAALSGQGVDGKSTCCGLAVSLPLRATDSALDTQAQEILTATTALPGYICQPAFC